MCRLCVRSRLEAHACAVQLAGSDSVVATPPECKWLFNLFLQPSLDFNMRDVFPDFPGDLDLGPITLMLATANHSAVVPIS